MKKIVWYMFDLIFLYTMILCYFNIFDIDTTMLHRGDFILPFYLWIVINIGINRLGRLYRRYKNGEIEPIKLNVKAIIKPIKLKPIKIKPKYIVALFSALLLIIPVKYVYNNIVLNDYVREINKVELPPGCIVMSSDKDVGRLYGNDNNIDFIVYYIVKTDMAEQQLREYFKNVKIPAADSSDKNSAVMINRQPDNKTIEVPDDCKFIVFADEGGKHF